eukprot:326975-Hanusia_phi.AAC.2
MRTRRDRRVLVQFEERKKPVPVVLNSISTIDAEGFDENGVETLSRINKQEPLSMSVYYVRKPVGDDARAYGGIS